MATTRNTYTGDGTTKKFGITFEYLRESDVKVFIDNVAITGFTFANATTLEFDTISSATDQQETTGAPKTGKEVRLQRETDVAETINTFFPGSAIRASDLNDNYLQTIFRQQELENDKLDNAGDTITGDLILDDRNIVIKEGADSVTITAPALSADRTLTIPDTTGTIVTTGDVNTVTGTMIGPDAINGDRIADDSVDSEHYVDGSIDLAHMSANSVDSDQYVDGSIDRVHLAPDVIDGSKLADNSVDSEHYVNGSIDREHLAADIVDGTKIDDNAIDSEHYVDGSIDREHLAADIIDGTKIDDNAIDSEHYVDGSIDNQHIANHTIQYGKLQEISTDHRLLGRDNNTDADVAEVQVATDMIADDQVTYGKMQNIATANRVLGSTSNNGIISEVQVATDMVANDAITDAKLADHASDDANRAVGTNHIKDSAVTSAKIADGTIVNDDINASAAIAGTKISMSLNQLSDVNVGTPGSANDGQVIAWDDTNSEFSLSAVSSSGGGLSDVESDSTPSLGGHLDVKDKKIFTDHGENTDIVLEPKGSGGINVSTSRIMNVTNPVNDQDAATKKYVDDNTINTVVEDSSPKLGGNLNVSENDSTHHNIVSSNNGDIIFAPNGTGSLGITSGSTLQAGPAGGVSNPSFIVEGTNTDGASIWVDYNGDDATDSANIVLGRSNSVNGSGDHIFGIAAVSDNDVLGKISFAGADGTDTNTVGAQIFARVDGDPASNDIPAELVFSTNSGSATPTERMAILPDGNITMGGQLTLGNAGDLVLKDNDGGGTVAIGVATDVTQNTILNLPATGPTTDNRFLRASGSTTGAGTHTLEWAQVDSSKSERIEHLNSTDGFSVAANSNAAMVGPLTVNDTKTITVPSTSLLKIL